MFEFATLLAFGSIGFWAVVLVAAVVVSLLVDDDRPGLATVVSAAAVGMLCWLGDLQPLAFMHAHPVQAALVIPGYLLVGTAWGYCKWGFYLDRTDRKAKEAAVAFQQRVETRRAAVIEERSSLHALREAGAHQRRETRLAMPDETQLAGWRKEALREAGVNRPLPLMVREHKSLILAWMAYWPASLLWTLVNDPVRRAFEAVYDRIGGSMQRMSDRRFAHLQDAFDTAKAAE